MYICGNCRIVISDSLREGYAHVVQCTDYYFDRIDSGSAQ